MPEGGQGLALTRVHAFGDDALGDLDAVGVARAVSEGSISALEATEAAIARAERVEPDLNAFVVTDFDRARSAARAPAAGAPDQKRRAPIFLSLRCGGESPRMQDVWHSKDW